MCKETFRLEKLVFDIISNDAIYRSYEKQYIASLCINDINGKEKNSLLMKQRAFNVILHNTPAHILQSILKVSI